jgi:hypothetical protein
MRRDITTPERLGEFSDEMIAVIITIRHQSRLS